MTQALPQQSRPLSEQDNVTLHPGDGVLLIGHGTRDSVGTQQFFALGELLAKRLSPWPVEACLLELQSPTIAEGWQRLRERGASRVLACPLLLFAAGHAKSDIPRALADCQQSTPEMAWRQARALSRAPELLRLVAQRLDGSIGKLSDDQTRDRVAVVMVGRGSYDPCAQADMKLLTHWMSGERPVKRYRTAFYAMAEPRLTSVLQQDAAADDIDQIIVQPHLLFAGQLYQSILEQVQSVADQFPTKRFICSDYLGPEPEVAQAICRRLIAVANETPTSS